MKKFNRVLSFLLILTICISLVCVPARADEAAVLSEETVVEETTATDETVSEEIETDETASEDTALDETASEDTALDETASEDAETGETEQEEPAQEEHETVTEPETTGNVLSLMDAEEEHTEEAVYINPVYAGIISEDDLVQSSSEMTLFDEPTEYADTLEEAGSIIRNAFAAHETAAQVTVDLQNGYFVGKDFNDFYKSILAEAFMETSDPTCGDYMRYHYGGGRVGYSYNSIRGTVTYTSTYYTTLEQEAVVTSTVADVIESLDLEGKDEDYKIAKIYDYITSHVVYDYDNLEDSSYTLKYSAYAALINGTSVCQGYANLFYRLCREAGLGVRIISGTGNGGPHGWNIVRIGNLYYDVDSTWDAGKSPSKYSYFLKCDANFVNHVRGSFDEDTDYADAAFYAAYPMSASDYAYPESAKVAATGVTLTSTPTNIYSNETCTITAHVQPENAYDRSVTWSMPGYTVGFGSSRSGHSITITPRGDEGYIVVNATTNDGNYVASLTIYVSAAPHVHTEEIIPAVAPTCTEYGLTEGKRCSECGATLIVQEVIPALGHIEEIVPAVAPTSTAPGLTEGVRCSVCGVTLVEPEEIPILFDNLDDAGVALRQAMLDRQESVALSWYFEPVDGEDIDQLILSQARSIHSKAIEHTGNPYGGTILSRNTSISGVTDSSTDKQYYYDGEHYIAYGEFKIRYKITDEQELQLKAKSDEIFNSFNLDGKTEYEKALIIFEYVSNNVQYDLNASHAYLLYGALVDGIAVCDGIAQLLYHFMLRAGIDCRYVTGYVSDTFDPSGTTIDSSTHAWNIVKIGDYYYNCDATWGNLINGQSDYFLVCDYNFQNNRYGDKFHGKRPGDAEFFAQFQMSPIDYKDDLWLEQGNIYDITLESGEYKSIVFEPTQSGRYTFATSGANHLVCAEIEPYFVDDTVIREESNIGNDISYIYKLQKGHRYTIYLGLDDDTQTDSFTVSMTKNYVEERTITSVLCEDSMFYYTGTGSTGICDQGSYMYYDIRPKDLTVTLDNGVVLAGTLDEVLYELDDVYEIFPEYSFTGDDQSYDNRWNAGTYDITLSFDSFTVDYQVEIAENPITSVSIDIDTLAYDDEYKETTNEGATGCIYHVNIDNIVVTTQNKTYHGDYDNVYQEICSDYPFAFEYSPVIKLKYYWGNQVGTHNCTVRLFGKEITFDFEIRHNPIRNIVVHDQIVTEDDQYLVHETVTDEHGQNTEVSYMAYPHEPSSVRVCFKDGTLFDGTVEEAMAYMSDNYDYHEQFHYDNTDSYNNRWDVGSYPVKISLRNISTSYNVIVKRTEYIPLVLDSETSVTIPAGGYEIFSFSMDETSWVCGFDQDSYDGLNTYLYDEYMNLITDNESREQGSNPVISYYIECGDTYYLKVSNTGDSAKGVGITPGKIFRIGIALNVNTVLYENQAVLKEEIINGEPVSYWWYDWNPTLTLWISTLGTLEGTLEEISNQVYERHGVELNYYVGCSYAYGTYQSYDNQWTVGSTNAQGFIQLYNCSYYSYQLTINEGPIVSMEIDDVTVSANSGTNETVVDNQGVEHTFMRYDVMPQHITVRTVDGDISGTAEEVISQLDQTYNTRFKYSISGDDQSYENEWGEGIHNLTFSIGNAALSYNFEITPDMGNTEPVCLGHTVTLDESIKLNYYFSIPDDLLYDDGAKLAFSQNGAVVSELMLADAALAEKDGITGYVFSLPLVTKEMADTISAVIIDSSGNESEPYVYSAKQYCEELIALHQDDPDLVALVKALMNYGASAQEYFGYNISNLANMFLNDEDKQINDVNYDEIALYETSWDFEVSAGITYYGATLDLLEDLNMKLYFNVAQGSDFGDYTFTLSDSGDNPAFLETGYGNYGPYARISGIFAADIDAEYIVNVMRNGEQVGYVYTSPFAYINSALSRGNFDDTLLNLLRAMYHYNKRANTYFEIK